MTIRKRSCSESHQDESEMNVAPSTKSSSVPIIIEDESCDCRHDAKKPLTKRARTATCDCTSLNLLVKAMECIQRDRKTSVVVDRVPSMCHEIATRSASSSVADFPVKTISIPKGRPLSRPPPLPMGRPLLAPPRLPTNLAPGQIMLRGAKTA